MSTQDRYIPSHLNGCWGEWFRLHFSVWSRKNGKRRTQKQFTEALNKYEYEGVPVSVSAPTVSNWLAGKYAPENVPFLACCWVLNVEPDAAAEEITAMPTRGAKSLIDFFKPNANYQKFKYPSEAKKHTLAAWDFLGAEFGDDHHVMYVTGNGLQPIPEQRGSFMYSPRRLALSHSGTDPVIDYDALLEDLKKTDPDFEFPENLFIARTHCESTSEEDFLSAYDKLGDDDIKFVEQLGEELAEYCRIRLEQYKQMSMDRIKLTEAASKRKMEKDPQSDGSLTKKEANIIEKQLRKDTSFQIGRTPEGNLVSYKIDRIKH